MKKLGWLGFVFLWLVLCALPTDGEVVVSKAGETVKLACGLPRGRTLEWYREGDRVVRVSNAGMTSKGTGDLAQRRTFLRQVNLEISSVKGEDAGRFTCKVDQRSVQHLLIVITVLASPSASLQLGSNATLQCQVKGFQGSGPAVQWRRPDGSLHPGSEVAHLEPVDRSHKGAWNCTFSYDGKPYSQRLDISVEEPMPKPGNPPGVGEEPGCKGCGSGAGGTSASPAPLPPPPLLLGLSWQLWVAIGVGCLVVVVLTVCIVHLCRRIQRKKRKLRRMKNSRQQLMPKEYCRCDRPAAATKLQPRVRPTAPPLRPLHVQ